MRFWSLGGVTRIAIETDGDFQLKTDHLDNPDRIFYDLSGTKPALTNKSLTVIPVSDHFVKQIRVAEPQHNVTRVVLDLETTVEASTSRLENPDRLIIELRAPGGGKSETTTTKRPSKHRRRWWNRLRRLCRNLWSIDSSRLRHRHQRLRCRLCGHRNRPMRSAPGIGDETSTAARASVTSNAAP